MRPLVMWMGPRFDRVGEHVVEEAQQATEGL